MSTLSTIARLKTMYEATLKEADKSVQEELFAEAYQKYDEAKELLVQLRELGFLTGTDEIVKSANEAMLILEETRASIRRVNDLLDYTEKVKLLRKPLMPGDDTIH